MSECVLKAFGLSLRTRVVDVLYPFNLFDLCFVFKSQESPGLGESYTEDLPNFSLSPQEYITNVSELSFDKYK